MTTHEAWVSIGPYKPADNDISAGKPRFVMEIEKKYMGATLEDLLKQVISSRFEKKVLEKYPNQQKNYTFTKDLITNYFASQGDQKVAFEVVTKEKGGFTTFSLVDVPIQDYFFRVPSRDSAKVKKMITLEVKEKGTVYSIM